MDNEGAPKNPKASLDAIANAKPITLGELALLERIKSPILHGDTKDTVKNITAMFVLKGGVSRTDALKLVESGELEGRALEWGDKVDPKQFMADLAGVLDSVAAFWQMLPRPEQKLNEDGTPKKDSASGTASTQS